MRRYDCIDELWSKLDFQNLTSTLLLGAAWLQLCVEEEEELAIGYVVDDVIASSWHEYEKPGSLSLLATLLVSV